MKHFLLIYDLADTYLEKRGPFRREHLARAWEAQARGELVLGGALSSPADHAVFLFQGETPVAAEAFAQDDPYVVNELVTGWRVREWTTVAGDLAVKPVRPENL